MRRSGRVVPDGSRRTLAAIGRLRTVQVCSNAPGWRRSAAVFLTSRLAARFAAEDDSELPIQRGEYCEKDECHWLGTTSSRHRGNRPQMDTWPDGCHRSFTEQKTRIIGVSFKLPVMLLVPVVFPIRCGGPCQSRWELPVSHWQCAD